MTSPSSDTRNSALDMPVVRLHPSSFPSMTFDLQRILESKRAYRHALAAKPITEKLRMLDALRERALAIRRAAPAAASNVVREQPSTYRPAKPA
jgi:hypothetical protein